MITLIWAPNVSKPRTSLSPQLPLNVGQSSSTSPCMTTDLVNTPTSALMSNAPTTISPKCVYLMIPVISCHRQHVRNTQRIVYVTCFTSTNVCISCRHMYFNIGRRILYVSLFKMLPMLRTMFINGLELWKYCQWRNYSYQNNSK